jgi:hypothetical protein
MVTPKLSPRPTRVPLWQTHPGASPLPGAPRRYRAGMLSETQRAGARELPLRRGSRGRNISVAISNRALLLSQKTEFGRVQPVAPP